jgi:hypothetical protein
MDVQPDFAWSAQGALHGFNASVAHTNNFSSWPASHCQQNWHVYCVALLGLLMEARQQGCTPGSASEHTACQQLLVGNRHVAGNVIETWPLPGLSRSKEQLQ